MKIEIDQTNKLFFSSDLHINHRRILEYCSRPFKNIDDMNFQIVSRWNKKVSKNDTVVFCGDFCFGSTEIFLNYYNKLNGNIIWVLGNHDKSIPKNFKSYDVLEFNYKGLQFFCSHYAHRVWNRFRHGSIHLYGHSHNSLPDDINSKSMDCGIDCHPNFEPFSLEEVLERMKSKTFTPIDHHKKKEI